MGQSKIKGTKIAMKKETLKEAKESFQVETKSNRKDLLIPIAKFVQLCDANIFLDFGTCIYEINFIMRINIIFSSYYSFP